jgi:hypothetical protein
VLLIISGNLTFWGGSADGRIPGLFLMRQLFE